MSTGTLNAFVRALQLSEGGSPSPPGQPSPSLDPTEPPSKFRFDSNRPDNSRSASRITFIPQVGWRTSVVFAQLCTILWRSVSVSLSVYFHVYNHNDMHYDARIMTFHFLQDRVDRFRRPLVSSAASSNAPTTSQTPSPPAPSTAPAFNLRFTTPSPSLPEPVDDNVAPGAYDDDYYYYDYYYDYYDDQNGTVANLGPLDPPTRPTEPSTRPTQGTTAKPFRFAARDSTRPTRRPALPRRPGSDGGNSAAGRYSTLSELIASLKEKSEDEPPAPPLTNSLSSAGDNNRDSRVLQDTTFSISRGADRDPARPSVEVRVTNSTESSVVVASVQTSHSVSVSEDVGPTTRLPPVGPPSSLASSSTARATTSPPPPQTTEEPQETTTRRSLSDIHETVDVAPAILPGQASPSTAAPRPPKRLDDFFPNINSDNDATEKPLRLPEGPPLTTSTEGASKPRLESLFNIEIDTKGHTITATDARLGAVEVADISSFIPPGYEEETTSSSTSTTSSTTTSTSTTEKADDLFESIVKKVDDISSFLPPGYEAEETSPESSSTTSTSTTQKTNLLDLFSAIQSSTDSTSTSTTTTEKGPLSGLLSEADLVDVSAFLPPGFKPSEEPETTEATTKKAPIIATVDPSSFLPPGFKPSEEPPSDGSATPLVPEIKTVDVSDFLPPGYKPSEEPASEATTQKLPVIQTVDISAFLPPGYKPTEEPSVESTSKKSLAVETVDISAFLPPGYKPTEEASSDSTTKKVPVVQTVDISAFLPPGYKPTEESVEDTTKKTPAAIQTVDVSAFLPPGYKPSSEDSSPSAPTAAETTTTTTTERPGPKGLVFPRRPSRPSYLTTPAPTAPTPSGPPPLKPTFRNLWDA